MQRKTRPRLDSVGVLPGIKSLWQDNLLLDYTIEVEDEQFKVHKVILSSVSDYFKAMLTGSMLESQTDRVRLEGQTSLAVSNMIEYIYLGRFGGKTASFEELLSCAVYLQIPSAIALCSKHLSDSIDMDNCFDIFSNFNNLSIKEYVDTTRSYIKSNWYEILKKCKPDEMSFNGFIGLLDFWEKSEWENYESAIQWISSDSENRQQYQNNLMSQIHFAVMTPDELAKVKQTETFVNSEGSWHELVDKAIKYHKLPTLLKVNRSSKQNVFRSDPSPVVFTLGEDQYPGEFYAVKDGRSWTKLESVMSYKASTMENPGFEKVSVLEVNNFLIVYTTSQRYHIFDPLTLEWSPMASMVRQRKACGMVHHGNELYALGGRIGTEEEVAVSDEIEQYDFETDTWQIIPYKMPAASHCHRLCQLGGLIYVLGGYTTPEVTQDFSTNFLSFNPSTGSWKSKAPQRQPLRYRCEVRVVNLNSQECILVIGDNVRTQYYTPATDQWSWLTFDGCDMWRLYLCKNPTLYARNRFYFLGCNVLLTPEQKEAYRNRESAYSWNEYYPSRCVVGELQKNMVACYGTKLDPFPIRKDMSCKSERPHFCALLSFRP